MSNYNEAITRRMIVSLANAYADRSDGGGKIEHTRKSGRFDGLVQGVHFALQAMDISPGAAPFAVEADVLAAVAVFGDRPKFTTGNQARKQWVIDITDFLLAKWAPKADEPEVNNLPTTVAGFLNGLLAGGTTNMVDDR